ncbi:TPA: hypothetical protein P6M77_001508 [Pseudomonas aeruginosa]|uniref:hypothetical protein n=1 Tax=Pseudomonas aeruginosa TaxID=287 RepID=UPI00071BDD7B|nr:hypothetical protein [Pseudomonas aeruginosa]AYW60739.1 hypothetical protein EGV93_17850 [Pseudomonas aeruginosa]KSP34856.1 hypothetical protein APB15_29885 [Pseudomonas aeruginosa]UOC61073.1 hypothetical protein IPV49_17375 [Pseudomonas aeruginosa]UOC67158.1 hypothetical protein IPV48_17350 [Pseudomonas aeruginosa]UOC73242.1 hypothetical protein IPV46_17375 [Pseudomonas aeruginosa]
MTVQSISDEQLAELEGYSQHPAFLGDEDSAITMGELRGLIARLRAAEAELSLWRPIMDEVERRAEKEWCLQDKRDFTVTIQYDDYVDIDAAMERTP